MPVTVAKFKARFAQGGSARTAQRCNDCKVVLRESQTGIRRSGRHHLCSNCYFLRVGKHVEEHPIHLQR